MIDPVQSETQFVPCGLGYLSYIVRPLLEPDCCHQQGRSGSKVLKRKRCCVSHPVPIAPSVVWYQIIRRFCHPLSAREKLKRRVTAIDWVDSLRILNTLNCFVCFRSNFSSLSFIFFLIVDLPPLHSECFYSSTFVLCLSLPLFSPFPHCGSHPLTATMPM